MGSASIALHPLADDLLLRRQPSREVRGGQGILRGLLSQTKTSRGVLYGIREGRRKTAHARVAGVGGGDSRACGSDLRRAVEGGELHSLRLRRHTAGVPSHRGTGAAPGDLRQGRLAADDLEHVHCPSDVGLSLLLAIGQRGQGQRAKPPDLHAALAARVGVDRGRCGICRLRGRRGDDLGERVLPHPHVLQRDLLQRSQGAVGRVPRGDRLLLAEDGSRTRENRRFAAA